MMKFLLLFSFCFILGCAPKISEEISGSERLEHLFIHNTSNIDLPYTVIYGGPIIKHTNCEIFKKGFTHIAYGSMDKELVKSLPKKQRALLWTGIVKSVKNQPWNTIKSPWGNNLSSYDKKWKRRLQIYSDHYQDNSNIPSLDLLVIDIESELYSDDKILGLKNDIFTPIGYKKMVDKQFIVQYKYDMAKLSNEPIKLISNIPNISSYGAVPIRRNWHGLKKNNFKELVDINKREYIASPKIGSQNNELMSSCNWITPSTYFFYKRPQNLAYALFQIEANVASSEKDVMVFHSSTYVGKKTYGTKIDTQLSEYMAVFPFLSGAKGIWLYEDAKYRKEWTDTSLQVYLAFNKGLGRLSKFKDILFDNYTIYIPKDAREHFVDKDPIWRAIVTKKKILIAACNPYADDDEITNLKIKYKGLNQTITLNGKELFLEDFNLK